jgi:hypothetical protein
MALILWAAKPGDFAGLVLDAAYPVLPDPAGTGRLGVLNPPRGEAVRSCPLFVLVGGDDGGTKVWTQIEDGYRRAGVPLTIHIVPGQKHAWLFGGAQRDKLYAWLAQVAAGQAPGAAASQPEDSRPASQPAGSPGPRKPIRVEDVY